MLNTEKLIKEMDNAINWIKEYVSKTKVKGLVVRE